MSFGVIYDDDNFNLTLPSVLGSNRNGTPYLTPTFPTTSTGTSLGHYHYTEPSTNSLKFLNASGTGNGGHQFWHSSSTEAPVKTLEINTTETKVDTQFVVEKSSTPPARVFSPPISSISPDNIHINFPDGTDLTQPPYNFNQTFNPIYMTQGTGFYTDNSLCYAVLGSLKQITIFNNDNITNPIPPNVVPTGFPIGDATGLVVGEPVFALTPYVPPTPQTAILSDTLEITTNTDTSILSATDLTFNGTSILSIPSTFSFTINSSPYSFPFVSTGQLTPQSSFSISITSSSITLITPTISTSSMISATLFRDNVFSPLGVILTTNSIVLTGNFSGTQTIYFSGFIFFS